MFREDLQPNRIRQIKIEQRPCITRIFFAQSDPNLKYEFHTTCHLLFWASYVHNMGVSQKQYYDKNSTQSTTEEMPT